MGNQSDYNNATTYGGQRYGIPVHLYTYFNASILLTCFVILSGNLVTLILFVKYTNLRKQRYTLICSLAVSDLLIGMVYGMDKLWELLSDPSQCLSAVSVSVIYTILVDVYMISMAHLIIIGIDRWIAVMFPLRYAGLVTVKATIIMVIVSWVLPVISIIPNMTIVLIENDKACARNMHTTTHSINSLLTYVFIVIIMTSIYGKIWCVARKQRRKIVDQNVTYAKNDQERSDTNKTVLIILCSYAGLNLPKTFYGVMSLLGQTDSRIMDVIHVISMGCVLVNSGVNVFIYALFTNDFKIVIRDIFHCRNQRHNDVNII